MKSIYYILAVSLFLAFLTVSALSNLQSELTVLGLFPGYILNWASEQLLIEIFNEPYFTLDNISAFFDLTKFGEFGTKLLILIAANLSIIFNFIFYSLVYFFVSISLKVLQSNYQNKCAE